MNELDPSTMPRFPAPDSLALLRHAARGQPLPADLTPDERHLLASPATARRLLAALTRPREALPSLPDVTDIPLPHGQAAGHALVFPDLEAIAPAQPRDGTGRLSRHERQATRILERIEAFYAAVRAAADGPRPPHVAHVWLHPSDHARLIRWCESAADFRSKMERRAVVGWGTWLTLAPARSDTVPVGVVLVDREAFALTPGE